MSHELVDAEVLDVRRRNGIFVLGHELLQRLELGTTPIERLGATRFKGIADFLDRSCDVLEYLSMMLCANQLDFIKLVFFGSKENGK